MNSTAATYTPLECLLLFQTLVAYGTEEQDFDRISNLLTDNDLVKSSEAYDAQRLSADSLRQLYLQLLRDELRSEEEVVDVVVVQLKMLDLQFQQVHLLFLVSLLVELLFLQVKVY